MIKDLISVIMAVYNCEDTLRQSIDSVLAQTYENWQFVICDDCSTDGTLAVVKEYQAKYPDKFIVIQNEVNSKLAFSLNHCLEHAEGEFVARMDGDDYIAPDRFEKQITYLKEHKDIQLVGTFMQTFNDAGEFGKVITYKKHPDKYDLRVGPVFSHASIMTYKSVYDALGGYTVSKRTVRSQDYDLWFRFFAAGYEGETIQEPLYFVRENENAVARRKVKVYFWATVTRFKGYRMLKYPPKYYIYVFKPTLAFFKTELVLLKYKLTGRGE